jgi:beta-RFAP synthase
MTSPRLQIRTPSRLHFGLLGWGPEVRRQFGGVGLMIESPAIVLSVDSAPAWQIEGPLASRVERIVSELRGRVHEAGRAVPAMRIRIERAPAEHVGLGAGTQLSLAVATLVLRKAGMADWGVEELARLTGRGGRSGIGLHGFGHGGLIVDGGRKRRDEIPPLLARVPFPEEWSVLVVQPPGRRGLHGPDENRAFAELPPVTRDVADTLCRLVLLEILPAVHERDLASFGAALGELQAKVGACFAPAQGGIFTAAAAPAIIAELERLWFVGAGQSSWGPTLYAFRECAEDEKSALAQRLIRRFGLEPASVFWTKAVNHGARILVGGKSGGVR